MKDRSVLLSYSRNFKKYFCTLTWAFIFMTAFTSTWVLVFASVWVQLSYPPTSECIAVIGLQLRQLCLLVSVQKVPQQRGNETQDRQRSLGTIPWLWKPKTTHLMCNELNSTRLFGGNKALNISKPWSILTFKDTAIHKFYQPHHACITATSLFAWRLYRTLLTRTKRWGHIATSMC